MTTFTSRGTAITKRLSETILVTLPLEQLLEAQGDFINILNEIYRHKGLQVDFNKICTNFVPNVEGGIFQFKKNIKDYADDIFPISGDHDDPQVVSIDLNATITIKCTISPYEEKPIEAIEAIYNDQGKIVE